MARALRIEEAGLTYHAWARGTGGMAIYRDDRDRERFLELLAQSLDAHDVVCHAFCLMTTHYHVVITTNKPNLSHAIQWLNSPYAQWWNHRHSRPGHVFQGRFGAQVVQDDAYLLTVCRYVVRNPVRAGMVASPELWRWSSYRATAGIEVVPPFLHLDMLRRSLGGDTDEEAARRYRQFAGFADDTRAMPHNLVLGDQSFVQRFNRTREVASAEVPKRDRRTVPPLNEFFACAFALSDRAARASHAHRAGYTMTEIAAFLGVHPTTVGKMIARAAKDCDRGTTSGNESSSRM
jgi:putative transposase